jgi:hypothetical protein
MVEDFNTWLGKKVLPDTSLIDRIDDALLRMNTKIATYWQNTTYKSKNDLEKRLYYGSSALSVGYVASSHDYLWLPLAGWSAFSGYLADLSNHYTVDDLPDDMKEKVEEDFSRFYKGLCLTLYADAAFNLFRGAGYTIDGIMHNNPSHIITGAEDLSFGTSMFLFATATYLGRIKIDDPPKRPKKKPVLERIKEGIYGILPQPIAHPAPAKYSS